MIITLKIIWNSYDKILVFFSSGRNMGIYVYIMCFCVHWKYLKNNF